MAKSAARRKAPREGEQGTVEGTASRIRFASDDGEFQVVVLALDDGGEQTVLARGALVQVGERIKARGRFKRHRSGELQLDAERIKREVPTTESGLATYLASGVIKGIGGHLAKKIVRRFGEDTIRVLDEQPERLMDVSGIGKKRAADVARAWREQAAVRDVMIFLQSHGISPAFAHRIYKRYGDKSVPIVRDNPYQLARDVHGIGFLSADRIAREVGIGRDDPRRISAGVGYALHKAGDEGHLFLPHAPLVEIATALLGVDEAPVREAIEREVAAGHLVEEPRPGDDGPAIYRREIFLAEEDLAARVASLSTTTPKLRPIDPAAMRRIESGLTFSLSSGQRAALSDLVGSPIGLLTGGPGTGKTTIIRAVVAHAHACRASVVLAAPTGRAAKRLAESTGEPAKTIHRLLEFDPKTAQFSRDEENPIEGQVVIVDEASMLDLFLARSLIRAVPRGACLLLVGDVDQLPSVGAGDVLRDLIESGALPVARLNRIFRQGENSQIVDAAHEIREGRVPAGADSRRGEYFFISVDDPEAALDRVLRVVTKRIPAAFKLDARRDVQVLVPAHRGPIGTQALNAALQDALVGDSAPSIAFGSAVFHVGDKVMQTRNNYDLDVYNGDIGVVCGLDGERRLLRVDFDGRVVELDGTTVDDLELAYAISVHKSQGSEFPAVVVVLMTHHFKLLQRNLVYTAVTRARERLVIIGMPRAFGIAVRNAEASTRYSRLAERVSRRAR